MSKKNFIKGTFILTLAGVLTRLLGFVFRIFLSRSIGAEGMGLYQLVMPVNAICYAIGISGFEVSISRFTAYYSEKKEFNKVKIHAFLCTFMSLLCCLICSMIMFFSADLLAEYVFHNPGCAILIRILVLSVPLSCIHCMVSSYYLGKEKTFIPAVSQLFEQIIRMTAVFIMVKLYSATGQTCDAALGIKGLVYGEAGAVLFCSVLFVMQRKKSGQKAAVRKKIANLSSYTKEIKSTALPICLNRLSLHGLQSIETILLPLMLQIYGYSETESLGVYGIISGMVLPIILFPATLSNSVSLMLLPSISRIQDSVTKLRDYARKAMLFSLIFGFICIIVFITVGGKIGAFVFNEPAIEGYIKVITWLCPFFFISSTYKSILNAMGKTSRVFANSMLSEFTNLLFVAIGVPRLGIKAFLSGMLISQMLNAFLHVLCFYKTLATQSARQS